MDVLCKRAKLCEDKHVDPIPWVPSLGLNQDDHKLLLQKGAWLNDRIVNASQRLLKQDFPHIGSLQKTLLGQSLSFSVESAEFAQVLHNGVNHWLCVTNIGCAKGEVVILNSLYSMLPSLL